MKKLIILIMFITLINLSLANATMINGTVTVLPLDTPFQPSGSGSSAGGGGVITNEPYKNIAETDRQERSWRASVPVKYTLKYDVYEVEVIGTENENDIMLKYEGLKEKSVTTKTYPQGTVSKYFNLYLGSQRIKSAVIRFKSEQPSILYRWISGDWKEQKTTEIGRDNKYIYYQSEVSGFSNFALVNIEAKVTATVSPTSVTTTTSETTPEIKDITPIQTPATRNSSTIIIAIAIMLIAVGVFVAYYLASEFRKKENK